jgi:replication factor C subunit 3/5
MIYIDKYKINNKDDLVFHKDIYENLYNLKNNNLPNLLFYGKAGSGKKTLINLFLKDLYGNSINNIKEINYPIKGYGNTSVDITIKKSNHHIIIKATSSGLDKYIIQEVVKNYAEKPTIRALNSQIKYKIIIIKNVDKLSYYAQTALRRTMEKYVKNCRFILMASQISKIITPICSRCIMIRIPTPNYSSIFETIFRISAKEKQMLTQNDYHDIIINSNGNIKVAIWLLELKKYNIDYKYQWKNVIEDITNIIMDNKKKDINTKTITNIRNMIYSIFVTNVNIVELLRELMLHILIAIDKYKTDNNLQIIENIKFKIINQTSIYETRLSNGKRFIIHLEAYIISVITLLYQL